MLKRKDGRAHFKRYSLLNTTEVHSNSRLEALLAFENFCKPLSAQYSTVILNISYFYSRKFANVGFYVIVLVCYYSFGF